MVKLAFVLALLLASTPALALPEPAVHHSPRSIAQVGEDLLVDASVDRPDRVKRVVLVYQAPDALKEVAFARASGSELLPYQAVIPRSAVHGARLAYAIEIETDDGARVPAFASRESMHPVTVLDAADDTREAALLARASGRRSVVQSSGEFVRFGRTHGADHSVPDQYYRVEGSYTYRLFGTVSEFGIRGGVVRGTSRLEGGEVGLNYGAPRIRVRLADWFHAEGELLMSVTEVGFATGGGGAVLLGDPYGTKLVTGVEGISVFGVRGYTRLDIVANRRLRLAPIVEVSNVPHADRAGVRLLGEAGVEVGAGLRIDVRGGYQARTFEQGGPTVGGGLAYAF